jgi:hypothetical protein
LAIGGDAAINAWAPLGGDIAPMGYGLSLAATATGLRHLLEAFEY